MEQKRHWSKGDNNSLTGSGPKSAIPKITEILGMKRNHILSVMCHVSCVICHIVPVTCHQSCRVMGSWDT